MDILTHAPAAQAAPDPVQDAVRNDAAVFAARLSQYLPEKPVPRLGVTRDNFISKTEKAANRISPDVYLTQRILPPIVPRNASSAAARLLQRVSESAVSMWRNPVRMRIQRWSRRELMHVFNGFFHAAIDDPERYETFGRCYTCPDPFRNDDPPYKAAFII